MGMLSRISASSNLSTRQKPPVEDIEKFTCNSFSVFRNLMLVNIALERSHKFVTVLFNDKSNELLGTTDFQTMQQSDSKERFTWVT